MQRTIQSIRHLDLGSIDRELVLRGATVTALLVLADLWIGRGDVVVPLSIGAVFVNLVESRPGETRPLATMATTTVLLTLCTGMAVACSSSSGLAVASSSAMAFVCGSSTKHSARTAIVALLTLVIFTIVVGIPATRPDSFLLMLPILIGGSTQTLAAWIMRPRQRGDMATKASRPREEATPTPSVGQRRQLRHALRLAITIGIATAIAESTGLRHHYWLPMSVAWMSKLDLDSTVDRVVHRVLGTTAGLALLAALELVTRVQGWALIVIAIVGAAITMAAIWINYAVAVAGVTLWIVGLFTLTGDPAVETLGLRLAATMLAALMVLLITGLPRYFKLYSR